MVPNVVTCYYRAMNQKVFLVIFMFVIMQEWRIVVSLTTQFTADLVPPTSTERPSIVGHHSVNKLHGHDYSEPRLDKKTLKKEDLARVDNVSVPYRLAILDKLLEDYDKRAWPNYGRSGKPTKVAVNIYVNSLGSVNAASMEYKMDMYLRQYWVDRRLNMSRFGFNETLILNGDDIAHLIWKPHLFFRNVKQANFHYVTVPNMLVKISPDGHVLYSMRLTLTLSCHMSFRNYPLDSQKCHVIVGAYAQTTKQTIVNWQDIDPITVDDQVEIPEFDIVSITRGEFTSSMDTGSFSFLNVTFVLQRQNGYHVVQTYLPTFLIVMISWVSFWLNVDASPARVTLGVTTLLTLTTVASGVRTQLPPVSYVKASDVWIGACSIMVFGALLEFAVVNFLSRSKLKGQDLEKAMTGKGSEPTDGCEVDISKKNFAPPVPFHLKQAKFVDRVSRVTFPMAFLIFNVIYWVYYLNNEQ